jgi:hypothetical protein
MKQKTTELDSFGSENGLVVNFFENDTEPSVYVKCEEFVDQLFVLTVSEDEIFSSNLVMKRNYTEFNVQSAISTYIHTNILTQKWPTHIYSFFPSTKEGKQTSEGRAQRKGKHMSSTLMSQIKLAP